MRIVRRKRAFAGIPARKQPVYARKRRLIMKKGIVVAAAVCIMGTLALAQGSRPRTATGEDSVKKPGDGRVVASEKGWKLVVYYLHGTYRCGTCMSIEKQSKEAVEGDFAKEIKAGRVVFLSVNFEDPEHSHFGTDYQLTTRSLVLSLRKDGKEVKWKNLPAIWTTVHNPPALREYVDGEVKAMLKEMK